MTAEYNRGTTTVSISGWSVQYASRTGATWSKTNLSGSIAPGGYFLIKENSGSSGGMALPAPDATGTISMSATKGKVALKTDQTTLTCSTGCATQAGVKDFVGYGSGTSSYEGSGPAPTLNNTTADLRAAGGATDTDDNVGDFATGAPNPRNSASGSGGGSGGGGSCSGDCIHDIQGAGHISPRNGMTVTVVSSGNPLPSATLVGPGGRVPPSSVIDDLSTGDVETRTTFDPVTQGVDFWESMEGMRVEIDNAAVVGPRHPVYGEIPVVAAGSGTRTNRGGIVLQSTDANPERVIVDDLLAATPAVDVGDTLSGAVTGVLDYAFGNFHLQVTSTPAVASGGVAPEVTAAAAGTELAVATFNVENLAPSDPQSKFDGLAAQITGRVFCSARTGA